MKEKFKVITLALLVSIVMSSQIFAVTYMPNNNDNINNENVSTLEEMYDIKDVEKINDIYVYSYELTNEEVDKYDLNKDGKVNAIDASLVISILE